VRHLMPITLRVELPPGYVFRRPPCGHGDHCHGHCVSVYGHTGTTVGELCLVSILEGCIQWSITDATGTDTASDEMVSLYALSLSLSLSLSLTHTHTLPPPSPVYLVY
jgi:hypothetical protein